jgi:hypothetical protein
MLHLLAREFAPVTGACQQAFDFTDKPRLRRALIRRFAVRSPEREKGE